MKNKFVYLFIGLLIVFVLYATLVTNIYHTALTIKEPFSKIYPQLSEPQKIAKWYEPFADADTAILKVNSQNKILYNSSSLTLNRATGLSVWYTVEENNKSQQVVFDLTLDSISSTIVTLNYESTLWNKLFGNNPIVSNAKKSLQNFSDYLSDTKKIYGYPIEFDNVSDTAFLFTSKVVSINSEKEAFKNLYEILIQYAKEKNAGYNGTRIFYTSKYGNDSIHLFTSIGITDTKNIGVTGPITLKMMPFKGHLLSAFYQGKFSDVNKVTDALEEFRSDNQMTTMAIPFIKLITEGIEFNDDQIIQAKAYYPIFNTNEYK